MSHLSLVLLRTWRRSHASPQAAQADAAAGGAVGAGGGPRWIILPLHGSLEAEEQDRAFARPPAGVRKCVLATNVAESAVTIAGVRFVADSGRAKEMTWDARGGGVRRLREGWISAASAEQRAGKPSWQISVKIAHIFQACCIGTDSLWRLGNVVFL